MLFLCEESADAVPDDFNACFLELICVANGRMIALVR